MSSSTSLPASKPVDVLIVGAGLSGLRAALDVQAAGLSCIVVEATDRVGGKTLTVSSKPRGPGVNDIGAAWINDTTQFEMYRLFQEYGLHLEVQRAEGMNLMQAAGAVVPYPHGTLPLEEGDQQAMELALQHIRELIEKVNLEDPAAGPNAGDLDSITVQDYCIKTFQSELFTGFIDTVTQSLVGVESKYISMLGFLHSCKTSTGIDAVMSDSKDGGQYLRAREGMQTISQKMAQKLEPDTLLLSTPITGIEQHPQTEICTVRSSQTNRTLQARKVILSIPTTLYSQISFDPPLPECKQRFAKNNRIGYYSKMIFIFDQPWWRTAGLSGVVDAEDGPIMFTRDTSIPEDEQWSISCFIVGNRGREWSHLSKTERQNTAWTQFRGIFEGAGIRRVPEPVNVLEMEWAKEEFFMGAPCPVSPPGVITSVDASALRDPFGQLHFMGTETALVWVGYMEGAVRSGSRGAREVVDALKGSSNV